MRQKKMPSSGRDTEALHLTPSGHIFGIIPLIDYISIDRIRVIIVHLKIVLGCTLNCSPDKGWIAGRSEASGGYGCCLARGNVSEFEAHELLHGPSPLLFLA